MYSQDVLISLRLFFLFKVIAVPDTFEEFLLKVKNKLGLHGNALVAVYNKSGGLLEDVELIRYKHISFFIKAVYKSK